MRVMWSNGLVSGCLFLLVVGLILGTFQQSEVHQARTENTELQSDLPVDADEATQTQFSVVKTIVLPAPPAIVQKEETGQVGLLPEQIDIGGSVVNIEPLKAKDEAAFTEKFFHDLRPLKPSSSKLSNEGSITEAQFKPIQPNNTNVVTSLLKKQEEKNRVSFPSSLPRFKSDRKFLNGRALLRIMEHGSGPLVEIGWPSNSKKSENLYSILQKCFGMRVGLVDPNGDIYLELGEKGLPWSPNLDQFSGFVRKSMGTVARYEKKEEKTIRIHHNFWKPADLVRFMPRTVDAYLLGNLASIIGPEYQQAKLVRATYDLQMGIPVVTRIVVDDVELEGKVDFSVVVGDRCGWG